MVFYSVIPAGGVGSRLWPISRQDRPKFLLDLTGHGRTLLQQAYDRLAPIADGTIVVTGRAHEKAVAMQLPEVAPSNILTEPSGRDSMAAIGLAAAVLCKRHPDVEVIIGSFAADHIIEPPASFQSAVRQAIARARQGEVVAIGVRPRWASSAFGYVRFDGATHLEGGGHPVLEFVEKPDTETAATYLSAGQYYWNAGMYVASARVLLEQLARYQPALAQGLHEIAASWDSPEQVEVMERVWPTLTKIAIDHAISEPLAKDGGMSMIPADFSWDDVGDFDALADLVALSTPETGEGTHVIALEDGPEFQVVNINSPGAVVAAANSEQVIAVANIPGAVIVQTGDALLVTTREHAQDVKQIVDHLTQAGAKNWL